MKRSPIQLLESNFDRVAVTANPKFDIDTSEMVGFEETALEFTTSCVQSGDFWDGVNLPDATFRDRTYRVRLGVRVAPSKRQEGPYAFEIVCTGVFLCTQEKVGNLDPETVVQEYGYTILCGTIREQLISITSRMRYGPRMLPTMSFIGYRSTEAGTSSDSMQEKRTEPSGSPAEGNS